MQYLFLKGRTIYLWSSRYAKEGSAYELWLECPLALSQDLSYIGKK
jgi:hypothetical protein